MKRQEQPAGSDPEFSHDEPQSRYVLRIGGAVAALAQYRRDGHAICFTHTEVDPRHEGQGLGSRLAALALDDVKRRGLKALPQCPFIAQYIAKHEEEYGGLVAQ